MMLLTTAVYPPHMAQKVGETYINIMDKYPDDSSIAEPLIPAAVSSTLKGINVISIYLIKDGKLKEAMDLASSRMLEFGKIQGFRYSIETVYDASEAMALLGLEAP